MSLPGFQSPESIAARLRIPTRKAAEAIEFLLRCGVLTRDSAGRLSIGQARIHLGTDSPWITRHHANWRLRAIESAERGDPAALHYSSVVSLSHEDAERIREILLKTIETAKPIIRDSREERVQGFCIDFFEA